MTKEPPNKKGFNFNFPFPLPRQGLKKKTSMFPPFFRSKIFFLLLETPILGINWQKFPVYPGSFFPKTQKPQYVLKSFCSFELFLPRPQKSVITPIGLKFLKN